MAGCHGRGEVALTVFLALVAISAAQVCPYSIITTYPTTTVFPTNAVADPSSLYNGSLTCTLMFAQLPLKAYFVFTDMNLSGGDTVAWSTGSEFIVNKTVTQIRGWMPPARGFYYSRDPLSTANYVVLSVRTDMRNFGGGFTVAVSTILPAQCNISTTSLPATGSITVPGLQNFPARYNPNLSCTYYLDTGSGASQMKLSISLMSLEPGKDFLRVYDGPETSAPVLAALTGLTNPATQLGQIVVSSGRYMTLQFTSDAQNEYFGFSVSWEPKTINTASCLVTPSLWRPGSFDVSTPFDGTRLTAGTVCVWNTSAQAGGRMVFTLLRLATAGALRVHDGFDGAGGLGPLLLNVTGTQYYDAIAPVYTRNATLVVVYSASAAPGAADYGFSATWANITASSCLPSSNSTFSPGQVKSLPIFGPTLSNNNGSTCLFKFSASVGYHINIVSSNFALQNGERVIVYDGDRTTVLASYINPWTATVPLNGRIDALSSSTQDLYLLLDAPFTSSIITSFTANSPAAPRRALCAPLRAMNGSGVIESTLGNPSDAPGNYLPGITRCSWLLQATGNGDYVVSFTLNTANYPLSSTSGDSKYTLRIFDGADMRASSIFDYTSDRYHDVPPYGQNLTLGSSGPNMFIYFSTPQSSVSGALPYWNGNFISVARSIDAVDVDASLLSGDYVFPSTDRSVRYPPNTSILFNIYASAPGDLPVMEITSFESEPLFDVLELRNGTADGWLLMSLNGYSYTGTTALNTIYPMAAMGPKLVVKFTADETFQYTGFKYSVYTVPKPADCNTMTSQSGSGTVSTTIPYLRATHYSPNKDCAWRLQASSVDPVVFLTFDVFDLYSNFSQALEEGDYLRLYDGYDATAPLIYEDNAYFPWVNVSSTGQYMFIVFHSNSIGETSGISASWRSVPRGQQCSGVQLATGGRIGAVAPYGTGLFYAPNLNCTWIIRAINMPRLKLTYFQGGVLYGDDLVIYDGDGPSVVDEVYSAYNDYFMLNEITPRNWVTVTFRSNNNTQGPSFVLGYEETAEYGTCIQNAISTYQTTGIIEAPVPWDGHRPIFGYRCQWTIYLDPTRYNQILVEMDVIDLLFNGFFFYSYNINWIGTAGLYLDAVYLQAGMPQAIYGNYFVTYDSFPFVDSYDGEYSGFHGNWTAIHVDYCSGLNYQQSYGGNFASHSPADGITVYQGNSTCSWLLEALAPSDQIRLYFDFIQLSGTLMIYDGPNASSPILANNPRVLPTAPTYGLASTGTTVYMEFQATFHSGPGFRGRWEGGNAPAQCAGVVSQTGSGIFGTPIPYDGANQYADNLNCVWQLAAAPGYGQVVIYYQALSFAAGTVLKIYDGASISSPSVAPPTALPYLAFASTGTNLLLQFTSGTNNAYGFIINWTSTNAPAVCQAYNFPANPAQGDLEYPPPWNGGFRYTGGLSCVWVLQAEPRVQLVMRELSTGSGDIVEVFDGYHTLAPLMRTFTGKKATIGQAALSQPLVSSTDYMLVRLTTSILAIPDYGFASTYQPTEALGSCPEKAMLPIYNCEYSGIIMTPSPFNSSNVVGQPYAKDCAWVIRANAGTNKINITINQFVVGPRAAIQVYDGTDRTAPLLYGGAFTISPSSPVSLIYSTGPSAFVFMTGAVGTAVSISWEAFGETGDARISVCDYIPIPQAPPIATTTSNETAAAVVEGLSGATIGLIAFGSIAAVVLIIVVVFLLLRMKRRKEDRIANGDSTVKLDIRSDVVMRKRVNGLLKAGSTKQIGKGGTAVVYKAKMEDGQWVALKQLMDPSEQAKTEFHREVTIFSRLAGHPHPNVIGLVLFCNDPPVIVCELAEKGSLHRMRKDFATMTVPQKKAVLLQLAEGMRFLHENEVVHLDLKPENVLVGEGNVLKISDFGTSLILGLDIPVDMLGRSMVSNRFTGTPQYSAPERFQSGAPIDLKRADVYSYGILAWSVASGSVPFEGETGDTIVSRLLSTGFDSIKEMALPDDCDPMIADIVRRAVIRDFTLRPLFFDLAATLRSDDLSAVPTLNYSAVSAKPVESITTNAAYVSEADFASFGAPPPPPSETASSATFASTAFSSGGAGSVGFPSTVASTTLQSATLSSVGGVAPPASTAPPPPSVRPASVSNAGSRKSLPPTPPTAAPPSAATASPPTAPADAAPATPRANPFAKK